LIVERAGTAVVGIEVVYESVGEGVVGRRGVCVGCKVLGALAFAS
jgi:hypothetical protein